jgi:hypothetical protein
MLICDVQLKSEKPLVAQSRTKRRSKPRHDNTHVRLRLHVAA